MDVETFCSAHPIQASLLSVAIISGSSALAAMSMTLMFLRAIRAVLGRLQIEVSSQVSEELAQRAGLRSTAPRNPRANGRPPSAESEGQ